MQRRFQILNLRDAVIVQEQLTLARWNRECGLPRDRPWAECQRQDDCQGFAQKKG